MEQQEQEFYHQRLFKVAGWSFLVALLSILLFNTFFYFHYKSKNEQLATPLFQSQAQLALLDTLSAKVTRQGIFLQRTQIGQNSKASFYADQLASTIPDGINLLDLEIYPIEGQLRDYREEDLIRFQNNRINITGQCTSSLIYNEWLKALPKMDWVKSANHLEYKDLNSSLGEFKLNLVLRE